jgi:hypothetical protein
MKTVLHGHYALSVCAAAAILAACGGSAQLPNPVAHSLATPQRVGRSSSGSEVLYGTARVRSGRCRRSSGSFTHFSAHGKATGPYPGTFTAKGRWSEDCFSGMQSRPNTFFCGWTLDETFTIKSGTSKVFGTVKGTGGEGWFPSCTVFGPEPYYYVQYTSNHGSGTVSIQSIEQGVFDESLDGL